MMINMKKIMVAMMKRMIMIGTRIKIIMMAMVRSTANTTNATWMIIKMEMAMQISI